MPELVKAIISLLSGGFLFFLAITVTRDNLSNRLNRVTGGMLFFAGLAPVGLAIGHFLTTSSVGPPIELSKLFSLFLVWEFLFPTLIAFALIYPVEKLKSSPRKRLLYLILLPQMVHILLFLLFSELSSLSTSLQESAVEGGFLSIILGPLSYIFSRLMLLLSFVRTYSAQIFGVVNIIYVGIAIALLESSRRRLANPRLASQMKWVVWAIRLGVGSYVLAFILNALSGKVDISMIVDILKLSSVPLGAGFISYAIVKHRFLDVRLVFKQSLVHTITSALLVGGYVFFSMKIGDLLVPSFGERAEVLSYISIILLLLIFPTVSNWIDNVIKSMFVRTTSDHRNILERFSKQLISMFEPRNIWQTIEETMKTSLLIENVYFVLYDDAVGEYALLRPEDFERETVIDREDIMLRGINLLDKPASYSSLSSFESGSALADILAEREVKLIMPLKDSHHLLGFLALTSKAAGYRYNPEDYNLLGVLSNQMVTALTNARLYVDSLEKIRLQEEVNMARQIQIDLLPDAPPTLDNIVICADSTPSRTVGGDFYDFIPVDNGKRTGIVIADASGKGMPAALMVAQIQAIIRSEVNNGNEIASIIKHTNQHIVRATSSEKYVTLFYGELDHESGAFHYTNAGHNYPILVRADGSVEYLVKGGPIVGALPDLEYVSSSVQLNHDDMLLMFTDGLSEAMDKEEKEYGEDRIRDFMIERRDLDPHTMISELVRDVRTHDPTYPPKDDTTIIAIKIGNGLKKI